jgi:hypothetical protein
MKLLRLLPLLVAVLAVSAKSKYCKTTQQPHCHPPPPPSLTPPPSFHAENYWAEILATPGSMFSGLKEPLTWSIGFNLTDGVSYAAPVDYKAKCWVYSMSSLNIADPELGVIKNRWHVIDYCLNRTKVPNDNPWAYTEYVVSGCGREAATKWCRAQGWDKAGWIGGKPFSVDIAEFRTVSMNNGYMCDGYKKLGCISFKGIECLKKNVKRGACYDKKNNNWGVGNRGRNNVGNYNCQKTLNCKDNVGDFNEKVNNLGDANGGFNNIGWGNKGKYHIGEGNEGTGNWGTGNKGKYNIGYKNKGNGNRGAHNIGNRNFGQFLVGNGLGGSGAAPPPPAGPKRKEAKKEKRLKKKEQDKKNKLRP